MLFLILSISLICVFLFIFIYLHGKSNELYWKKRGISFYSKNKMFSLFWDFATKDNAFFENLHEVYKLYQDQPAVGLGGLFSPILFVLDPGNIQHVLVTEFNSFNHRGIEGNESDLLADNLLLQTGKRWKIMRQSMTPLFTTAKIKSMYYTMDRVAQDFVKYLRDNPGLRDGDTFHLLSTFCSVAMGETVFGIKTNSISESPFLEMAKNAFGTNLLTNFRVTFGILCPSLFKMLQIKLFKEYEPFFIGAIKQLLRLRKQDKIKKHDFADLCLALQSNGKLKDENGMEIQITDELLAAQGFFFFSAGIEPSATVMYAVLMELGRNPDILKRIHEEIDNVFKKNNGHLSYEVISDTKYLDMVMNEAMRLHPAIGFLTRRCTKDTYLPVGNIKVDKGTYVFLPVFDVHRDKKYYPDAEDFNPERFSNQNKYNIKENAYLPFGKGGRNCIGKRYASYQLKAGLIHLLRNFTVITKVPETGIRYKKEVLAVRTKNVDLRLLDRDSLKIC